MAFPQDPLPLVSEILIDGNWVEISRVGGASRVGHGSSAQQVNISRGRRDIQGTVPPTSCDFVINNRDGLFTNDNPLSPYYKKLPIFTQVRHRIEDSSLAGYFLFSGGANNRITTPDTPALDVTGDLDLRIEIDPHTWDGLDTSGDGIPELRVLASKAGNSSSEISWYWALQGDGQMYFFWTTGGTLASTPGVRNNVTRFPVTSQRMALRVTVDVDNGAGQNATAFYYSSSIDGPWTLLSTSTGTGVSSIYSGTGTLQVGGAVTNYINHRQFGGRLYAFQMRNGINGTVVANLDARQMLPPGTTSFTDSATRVWTLTTPTMITLLSDKVRFHGEMEAMPQEWDSTGVDCWVPVHAADVLQRLGNDSAPLEDAITQYLRRYTTITGHWPLTDGAATDAPFSAVSGVGSGQSVNYNYVTSSDLPGSTGYAAAQGVGSFIRGQGRTTPPSGIAGALWWMRNPTLPAPGVALTETDVISFNTTGSNVKWWKINMSTKENMILYGYGTDGTQIAYAGFGNGYPVFDPTRWYAISLTLVQNGANIDYSLSWCNYDRPETFFGFTQSVAGTAGRINGWTATSQANAPDTQLAHMTLLQENVYLGGTDTVNASSAFTGERAADRVRRVCSDSGIPVVIEGAAESSSRLGPQPVDTLLNVLRDAEKTDGGMLIGTRSRLGITYVTRNRISQQFRSGSFSHDASHFSAPPKPVPDSFGVVNDATVSRRVGGGSARAIVQGGPRGTAAIGTVASSDTVNVINLSNALDIASWNAALGTFDAPRYPSVPFRLERKDSLLGSPLAAQIAGLDAGRYFEIADLPPHQAPGPIELLVQGYSEVLGNRTMQLDFSSSAFGPWRSGQIQGLAGAPRWAAADTSILAATASETVLIFVTPGSSMVIQEGGTFEDAAGVSRWVGTNGVIALSSAQALSGTYSLSLTANGGTTTAAARQNGTANKALVTAGMQYRAEFLAYATVTVPSMQISIDWANAANSFISGSASGSVSLTAGSWTYFSVTATAPANAAYASYGPTLTGTPPAGTQVFVDNAYIYPTVREKSTRWITSSELPSAFPMDVMIGGEKMTISAIHGQGEVQCAHVTRAVNGISKAHARGTGAQIARVTTFGR